MKYVQIPWEEDYTPTRNEIDAYCRGFIDTEGIMIRNKLYLKYYNETTFGELKF